MSLLAVGIICSNPYHERQERKGPGVCDKLFRETLTGKKRDTLKRVH